MYKHNNAYPILASYEMLPREQIRVNPERELDPLSRAELTNIKRGIPYKLVIADTSTNRENIFFKTSYYQMVAYKEGWKFNPELYQVQFVEPNIIGRKHARIYQFEKGASTPFNPLSVVHRAGFDIDEDSNIAERIENKDADGLVGRILKLFK
jgi:hypothetical protein